MTNATKQMAYPTDGHVIQAKATRPSTSPGQRHQTTTVHQTSLGAIVAGSSNLE